MRVVLLAGVSLSLLGLPALDARADSSAAAPDTTLRIATYNVQVRRSADEFRAGVSPLLDRADVIGLQEVDTGTIGTKASVLDSFAENGWATFRRKPVLQTPVLWRTDRFTFVSARAVKVSARTHVGHEPPMKSLQLARHVTVVHLRDKLTGATIAVIDVHLISEATQAGRMWPGHPNLYRLYQRELRALVALTRSESSVGQVFVLGDFNCGYIADIRHHNKRLPVRQFRRLGMVSMWATEHPPKWGTHSDALIDQVFSTSPATSAKVQFDIEHSDHRPAIATYASDLATG